MRSLVVGGTGFLGGAIADAALQCGHTVAVLSRGATVRDLPAQVEIVKADRYGELRALNGRTFDCVFDTCAFTPDAVRGLLGALGGKPGRYVLASSLSAYGRYDRPGLQETDPVPDATDEDYARAAGVAPADRGSAVAYGPSYGPLKRACEQAAAQLLGDRATALRIGLIVGAGDYTDRLTWWVRRIDEAGKGCDRVVPAPAPSDRPVQLIDVRDAAEFAVHCAAQDLGGVLNVTGPVMPMAALFDAIHKATGSRADTRWIAPEAFAEAGAAPWSDVPLMVPGIPEFRHFLEVSTALARSKGLTQRPLADTLAGLVDWDRGRRDVALKCGMSAEQERRILEGR